MPSFDGSETLAWRSWPYLDAQDRLLSARQQSLCVGGEDEGPAAAASVYPREFWQRQGEATTGDTGALQEGEDQPDRRVPADAGSDSGFLRALQSPVCHHRDASGAVLRLDQGSVCPRPHQPVQSFRADPVRPGVSASAWRVSCARSLAAADGLHAVGADEARAGVARSGAIGCPELDAGYLHLHAGQVLGRPGDLLDLE